MWLGSRRATLSTIHARQSEARPSARGMRSTASACSMSPTFCGCTVAGASLRAFWSLSCSPLKKGIDGRWRMTESAHARLHAFCTVAPARSAQACYVRNAA